MRNRFLGSLLLLAATVAGQAPDQTVRMKIMLGDGKTTLGDIDVVLLPSVAPLTVANFMNYVNKGAYNNTVFHRSVPGFIIQTGGYILNGNDFTTKVVQDAAVKNEYNISNTRGTVAMAKLGSNPNSATNEFFFNLADNSANLNSQNGGFTVFGRVANATSQAVVDRIANAPVPTYFNSPWDAMPLFNYRSGTPGAGNIITIQSITAIDGPVSPAITSDGIVVASAFGGGKTVAPGGYIEIYGVGLAATTRGWADSDFTTGATSIAPQVLDLVRVTVNGSPAFVSYVSPGQVNVQVPDNLLPGDAVPVVVSLNSLPSAAVTIKVKDFAGGILAPPSFKVGDVQYVAAVHDSTKKFVNGGNIPNVDTAPAVPGEILTLYGTGFGAITPNFPLLGGRKASGLTALTNPIVVKIGDIEAKILYAGLAPSYVGLYQFNIVVPDNAPSGDLPLVILQGGNAIEQSLFLTVKRPN